jgi:hypothetical protein
MDNPATPTPEDEVCDEDTGQEEGRDKYCSYGIGVHGSLCSLSEIRSKRRES